MFKNLSVSKRIYLSFVVLILFVLGVVAVSYNNSNRLIYGTEWIVHTHEVIESLDHIIKNLDDAETGQRGYLLTEEERYLEPYKLATVKINEDIDELQELTGDNPVQQKNIDELKPMVAEKLAELEETINLRRAGDMEAAINLVLTDRGKNVMDKIRVLIQDMVDEEQRLLKERSQVPGEAQRATNILMIILVSLSILVSGSIAVLISRSIAKPIRFLHRGIEIVKKGNLDYKVGTDSKDEIGQLSRSFDIMTAAIKKSRAEVDMKVEQQTKEISQEKDKINAILHSIGDGVFVIDADYKIILFNQVAADISGFTTEEAIGKKYDKILKFVFEESKKTNDKFIKDIFKTGKIQEMSGHTLLITKDKQEIPVGDSAAPLKDAAGKIIGAVVVFRDITHEREVDRAKTEFVSLASHQLRTPLTSINWYVEMLLSGDAGKLNKKQEEFLNEVYQGNQRMVGLINALLNVSRIDLGTFPIEPELTNFIEIADSVLKELLSQIEDKKMNLQREYDKSLPLINADPKLIRIVFQNLLSNAVKYTPERKQITLKIIKQGPNVLISVSDTGYGIPKNQQSKIFQKLFRADNVREKDTDGTGLGLYIVKAIVEKSGGKIWFESEENKGTTFYVTIPLKGMTKKKGIKGLS